MEARGPGQGREGWWEGPGSLELAAVAGRGASGRAWELLRRRSRVGLPRAGASLRWGRALAAHGNISCGSKAFSFPRSLPHLAASLGTAARRCPSGSPLQVATSCQGPGAAVFCVRPGPGCATAEGWGSL